MQILSILAWALDSSLCTPTEISPNHQRECLKLPDIDMIVKRLSWLSIQTEKTLLGTIESYDTI